MKKVTAFSSSAVSQVGDVTFTTKNGGNAVHGSLFEYFQNDALDASPYGFSGEGSKSSAAFGGSYFERAGTIPRCCCLGRTRRSLWTEGNRRSTAVAQQFLVPTAAERAAI